MLTVFALLVIYQIKHFVADYLLQTEWMLGKFKAGWEFVLPLTAHVSVHGALTFWIAVTVTGSFELALSLALIDMVLHFAMDRFKASPRLLGRYKPVSASEYEYIKSLSGPAYEVLAPRLRSNRLFWVSIGLDQAVHHLTHYLLIYLMVVR